MHCPVTERQPPVAGENFADMFAASERDNAGAPKRTKLRPGDRVRGKIISLGETVFLELQGEHDGQEGMLDVVAQRDNKGQLQAKEGDVIAAVVAELPRGRRKVDLRRSHG